VANMRYKVTRTGISRQDLAQDRAFWHDLLARCARSRGLMPHSAGGYRNRRFAIMRNAAWITLYRARLPFPQVGVFLRCAGLAGDAFFTLADHVRAEIEPRLHAENRSGRSDGMGRHPPSRDDRYLFSQPPYHGTTERPASMLRGCFGSAPRGGTASHSWASGADVEDRVSATPFYYRH
jgi:hypothetical protein